MILTLRVREALDATPRARIIRLDLDGHNDLKDLVDRADTSLYFPCGPTSMVSDTKRLLGDCGVASDRIRIEQW